MGNATGVAPVIPENFNHEGYSHRALENGKRGAARLKMKRAAPIAALPASYGGAGRSALGQAQDALPDDVVLNFAGAAGYRQRPRGQHPV
jgi:hypothetical protein